MTAAAILLTKKKETYMEKAMYYADIAEQYYNAACPDHALNGYEKNVLLDMRTEKCIFVPSDVTPAPDELLVRCKRVRGNTYTTLKTPKEGKETKKRKVTGARAYEGRVCNVNYGDYKKRVVYMPDELDYNPSCRKLKALKVKNLDMYLMDTGGRCDGYLSPYEVLAQLNDEAEADFGVMELLETYRICNAADPEEERPTARPSDKEMYVFIFSHFEKMSDGLTEGLCAVYEYTGRTGI